MKRYLPSIAVAALLVLLFQCGCTTISGTAYKAIATIEATVDKAMVGWGDYVQMQRAAMVDLSGQEARVRTAYTAYRNAMNLVYDARATATAADLDSQIAAAKLAAIDLIQLVDALLPAEKKMNLKL